MASDTLLQIVGLVLIVAAVAIVLALEAPVGKRLVFGAAYEELEFERSLMEVRLPFIEAAATRDPSVVEKARWRSSLPVAPPSFEWAALADRIGAADEEWADRPPLPPEEPARWDLANDQLLANWESLRERRLGSGVRRVQRALRLAWVGGGVGVVLMLAGGLHVTAGLWSAPPAGRASFVPDPPLGRPVYLAPLGDVQPAELQALADFYSERYGLRVDVLPQAPIPAAAWDAARGQLVAEALVDGLRIAHPEAADPVNIVVGVTDEDLYIRERVDWAWAFGMRSGGRLAVLSTARMGPVPGPWGHQLEAARLRKMVTKYMGVMYYGLPESNDPRSVLYGNILSVPDLDTMGEDF